LRAGHHGVGMREFAGDELLARPVRLHGIDLGRPVDLLLERDGLRAVGFDVLCRDEVHRFLPLLTASIGDDGVDILSPLVLLEEDELDFYRSRAFALSSLRGRPVTQARRGAGNLRDVVVAVDGSLVAVVLENGRRVPFDGTLQFAPPKRTAA
jgi:hypothetical protein